MKKQIKILFLIANTINILFIFSLSILAQSKAKSSKFPLVTLNQDHLLDNSTNKFDLINIQSNKLFNNSLNNLFAPPTPDFSEMEKWYEIVKYEYTDPSVETKLFIWVKPKVEKRPLGGFQMEFRDKDGALVGGYAQPIRDIDFREAVGKVTKTYCDLPPSERLIEKIATAAVIRVKS